MTALLRVLTSYLMELYCICHWTIPIWDFHVYVHCKLHIVVDLYSVLADVV